MFYKRYAIHELGTEIGQARKRSPGVLKDIAIKIEAHGTISGHCTDDRAPDQPRGRMARRATRRASRRKPRSDAESQAAPRCMVQSHISNDAWSSAETRTATSRPRLLSPGQDLTATTALGNQDADMNAPRPWDASGYRGQKRELKTYHALWETNPKTSHPELCAQNLHWRHHCTDNKAIFDRMKFSVQRVKRSPDSKIMLRLAMRPVRNNLTTCSSSQVPHSDESDEASLIGAHWQAPLQPGAPLEGGVPLVAMAPANVLLPVVQ